VFFEQYFVIAGEEDVHSMYLQKNCPNTFDQVWSQFECTNFFCVIGYFQEIMVFTPEAVFIRCFMVLLVLEDLGFLTSAKHFHFIDFKYIAFQLNASDYQGIALVINENLCSTRAIFRVGDTCFIPDEADAIAVACS